MIKEHSHLIDQQHSGGMPKYACTTLRGSAYFLDWFLFTSKNKIKFRKTFHSGDYEDLSLETFFSNNLKTRILQDMWFLQNVVLP